MEELLIHNPSQHDTVSFEIYLNEQLMDSSYELLSISIDKEINRIPVARILLKDGDAALGNFELSNKEDFVPGNQVVIKLGFDSDNKTAFKGIITKQQVKVKENGNSQLYIECRDNAIQMTLSRRSKYFLNEKDDGIMESIIKSYADLTSSVESTKVPHKEIIQHHLTDWDFLLLRAEANGQLINVSNGEVRIEFPKTDADPVMQLTYGSSIVEFEAEMDIKNQWAKVEANAWDYKNQKIASEEIEKAKDFIEQGNVESSFLAEKNKLDKYQLQHSGQLLEEELKAWAEGTMMRSRLSKIQGRARFTGFENIKPGDMVKIASVSDRFNGNAYVTAVRQDMGDGTWYTHIQFGLNSNNYCTQYTDINAHSASGLLGAIEGLQIGKVLQLENDPEGEDRILVKIPIIDNSSNGTWVRVNCLDAGNERGTFFRPEIDDEIIVGFINNDPRHAVMLGMLNSSAKPAPLKGSDANDEKGFFSRSKMRIHFNDSSKTITIDTPAGNSIILDEDGKKIEIQDQNQNKIVMDNNGILIESPKKIELKAGTELKITAGTKLSVIGKTMNLKSDTNVNVSASMAKISATGVAEIKGSMVKIN